MGKIKKLIRNRRRKRRKLRKRIRPRKRELRREAAALVKPWHEARDAVRAHKRRGEEVPAEVAKAAERASRELRRARARVDAAEDRARAQKGRIARAARKLKRARRERDRELVSRAEWGASGPRGGLIPQGALRGRCQHHTANPALPASASVATEAARVRQIQASHFARGMTDIAYARITMPSGRVYEGRDPRKVGAGAYGYNTGWLHAAMDANFENDRPTVKALETQRRTWREIGGGGLDLVGHYQLNATACPGRNLKPKLDSL